MTSKKIGNSLSPFSLGPVHKIYIYCLSANLKYISTPSPFSVDLTYGSPLRRDGGHDNVLVQCVAQGVEGGRAFISKVVAHITADGHGPLG